MHTLFQIVRVHELSNFRTLIRCTKQLRHSKDVMVDDVQKNSRFYQLQEGGKVTKDEFKKYGAQVDGKFITSPNTIHGTGISYLLIYSFTY